MGNAEQAHK